MAHAHLAARLTLPGREPQRAARVAPQYELHRARAESAFAVIDEHRRRHRGNVGSHDFEDNALSAGTQSFSVNAADGTPLAIRTWPAPAGRVRGTVLIVHGIGEHSGRHARLATRLRAWGWAPVAYDHRGHGASGGRRGVLRRRDDLITDLATIVDTTRPADGTPFLLFGHSMGGLVAAQFVADAVRPVDGLVLSSPALAGKLTAAQRVKLALGRALAPDLAVPNGFDPSTLSHDPEVARAYRADPLVHDRVSAKLAQSLLDAGPRVLARASDWRVPTLLLWAGDDHLVSPTGSAAFASRAPTDIVESHVFATLRHEIMNETDPEPVFTALGVWLDRRFPLTV